MRQAFKRMALEKSDPFRSALLRSTLERSAAVKEEPARLASFMTASVSTAFENAVLGMEARLKSALVASAPSNFMPVPEICNMLAATMVTPLKSEPVMSVSLSERWGMVLPRSHFFFA